jgi:hypothetical protein
MPYSTTMYCNLTFSEMSKNYFILFIHFLSSPLDASRSRWKQCRFQSAVCFYPNIGSSFYRFGAVRRNGELSLLRWSSPYRCGALPMDGELSLLLRSSYLWMGSSSYHDGALICGWGVLSIVVELFLWMGSSPYHVLLFCS